MRVDPGEGPRHPKRIAVLSGYGTGNLGDELILSSLVGLLGRAYPGVEVRAFAEDPELTARLQGIGTAALEPYRPWRWTLARIRRLQLAEARRGRRAVRATEALLDWCDLLVLGGGNLLTDHPAYFLEHYVGQIATRAVARGTPLAVLGAGASPVNTPEGHRLLALLATEWASAIAVREAAAAELLTRAGARHARVMGDPVFVHPPSSRGSVGAGASEAQGPVGLALRPVIGDAQPGGLDVALAEALAPSYGLRGIALHPAVDVPALQHPALPVVAAGGMAALVDEIRACGGLVSMRLHGLIVAAPLGIPAVGLAYHPKVERFADFLGTFPALPLDGRSATDVARSVGRALREQMEEDRSPRVRRAQELRRDCLEALERSLQDLPFDPPCPLGAPESVSS